MRILHVEDDPTYAALVPRILTGIRRDLELTHAPTASDALRLAKASAPSLVLLDHRLPDRSGIEVLDELRSVCPSVPVVFLTVMSSPRLVVRALRAGASDFVAKDDSMVRVLPAVVREALDGTRREIADRTTPGPTKRASDALAALVGASPAMEQVRELVRIAGRTNAPVLIEGETGTGKELVARAIHASSARRARPCLPVNCAAIPESLAESELFGHTRGAFTGAHRDKEGLFEAACGGTLFLDEIEELPLALQAKMLRVLQDLEYRPVGSTTVRHADVRIVAASNQNSGELVQAGRLRADLYYRLRVLSIVVPPLRLRREDVPALATHFVERFNRRYDCRLGALPPGLVARLSSAQWPGNVRELENAIESLCVTALGTDRSLDSVTHALPRGSMTPAPLDERSRILHALDSHHWSRQAAARALGISRVTLWRRMARLGVREAAAQEPSG